MFGICRSPDECSNVGGVGDGACAAGIYVTLSSENILFHVKLMLSSVKTLIIWFSKKD